MLKCIYGGAVNIGNCYIEEINNQIEMLKQSIMQLENINPVTDVEQKTIEQIILKLKSEISKRKACIIYN